MERIAFQETPYKDSEILENLHPFVREWFTEKFEGFSPPQKYAIRNIQLGINSLISSPTGSGKTLSAFLAIINDLVTKADTGTLQDQVYCVYISPLRALANDINKNLTEPLREIGEIAQRYQRELPIRVGTRTGDTSKYERSKMLQKPPHILITTPESLAILLTTTKFSEMLKPAKYVIVDEIHAIAENKRGTHLSLSLERLDRQSNFTRIGLSATVAPLEEVAKYLAGLEDPNNELFRPCQIIDVRRLEEEKVKSLDLQVMSPVKDLINSSHFKMQEGIYAQLNDLIQSHRSTLIFTNTRSATERVVHQLKERYPRQYANILDVDSEQENLEDAEGIDHENLAKEAELGNEAEESSQEVKDLIGAHHGSLSRKHRVRIEDMLKRGELKCVVCSTSLEMGIDIGFIDLVILLGSPKSVARALQRCLPYDQELLTSTGEYMKIGDIVENERDVELISYNQEKGFVKNKICKRIKSTSSIIHNITLKSGETLSCTEEHPILTGNGWKEAKDLRKGDLVANICNDIPFDNDEPYIYELLPKDKIFVENADNYYRKVIDGTLYQQGINLIEFSQKYNIPYSRLQDCRRKKGRRKSVRLDYFLKVCYIGKQTEEEYIKYLSKIKTASHHRTKLPVKLTEEMMWLAGIIATDGSIVKSGGKTPYYHIKIGNRSEVLIDKAQHIFQKYGFKTHKYQRNDKIICLECGSIIIAYLMMSLGIPCKKKTSEVEVGKAIFRLTPKLQHAYLEGIFEGDGNYNQFMRIFSASSEFSLGLNRLFHRLGYNCNIRKIKSKKSKLIPKVNIKEIYVIYIARKSDNKRFFRNIPLYGEKSKRAFKKTKGQYKRQKLSHQSKYLHYIQISDITKTKSNILTYNLTLEDPNNNYIIGNIVTHNCGRSGHKLHAEPKGRIIVLDRDDLVECSILLKAALQSKIDRISMPKNALDVLAQHLYGMAIEQVTSVEEAWKRVRQSYPYMSLTRKDFDNTMKYLAGEHASLEERNIYGKIWIDREQGTFGKRGKLARLIYMTNVGTIPDQTAVRVKLGESTIGTITEEFLERLKPGDVFVLGGEPYEFRFTRGMTAQVRTSAGRLPTVPNWISERLPLNHDLALEIQTFRRYLSELFEQKQSKAQIISWLQDYLPNDEQAIEALYHYFREQHEYSCIPHEKRILLEHFKDGNKKYVFFHTLYGRRVNDVLARAVAYVNGRLTGRDVEMGITDNGFYLKSTQPIQAHRALKAVKPDELERLMEQALDKSEVLNRRFRHVAGRGLMILREYKGKKKSVGRQQVSSRIMMGAAKKAGNDFPLLKEARREVLEDLMDMESARKIIQRITSGAIQIREENTQIPSPFAFNMVLQGYIDILKMEDRVEFVRRLHKMVLEKIEGKAHVKNEVLPKVSFSYQNLWDAQEEEKRKKEEDYDEYLKGQLMSAAQKVSLPSDMRYHALRLISGEKSGYPEAFKQWLEELLSGTVPKAWPDDIIKFFWEKKDEI